MTKQKQSKKKYDLISIGRSGVDLYGDQFGGRLEDMLSLSKYVGGCPANIAIGTSRLGLNVAMITRVGNEQMGRYLIDHFAQNGVDTQYIVSDKERLTTLVLLGIQDDTTFPLLYYRQHCADMGMIAADVKEEAIAATKAILISGTHLSAPNTKEMLFHAVKLAAKHGVKVIFDIDYRPTLWGLTDLGGGESRYIQRLGGHQALPRDPAALRHDRRHRRRIQHSRWQFGPAGIPARHSQTQQSKFYI